MSSLLLHCFWLNYIIIACIQVFYYGYFFSRLAGYKARKEPHSEDNPLPVSVIICAKDEAHNLQRNLPKILQQHYETPQHQPQYEVIVVNDNSEDDTSFVLRYLSPGYPHFHLLELQQSAKGIPGKKYPLTIGIKKSLYDTLILTDADCRPAGTHWLELMAGKFKGDIEVVLGYGAYEMRPGFLNKVIRFETFFSAMQYLSFALAGTPYMGVGRNLAYKKELFFRHKGFLSHSNLPSGDDDLFINAAAHKGNTAVLIHPEAITYSEPKTSWSAWYRQKTRHLSTGAQYKVKHQILLGLFSFSQCLYYPLFILALFYRPLLYYTIGIFIIRLILTFIIWAGGLKKLNEKKLFWYCLPLEILMCLYYLIFAPALIRKPKRSWN